MKLISKKVCACWSSMPIVNCKEWASRPVIYLFELRFNNIQNYRDSIFIIISYNTLMSVCWITANYSIFFTSKLCRMIWSNKSVDLFLFHFYIFLLLLYSHYKSSVGCQLILTFWLMNVLMTRFLRWFLYFLMSRRWLGSTLIFISTILLDITLRFISNTWACSKFIDSLWGWWPTLGLIMSII